MIGKKTEAMGMQNVMMITVKDSRLMEQNEQFISVIS
jgi:hypothetical protein